MEVINDVIIQRSVESSCLHVPYEISSVIIVGGESNTEVSNLEYLVWASSLGKK